MNIQIYERCDYEKIGLPKISHKMILELYSSVGWSNYTKQIDILVDAIEKTPIVFYCIVNDELIAILRAFSDEHFILYIQDILVKEKYQRQGIGRKIMDRCLVKYAKVKTKILMTDNDEFQHKFYKSSNFLNSKERKDLNVFIKNEI